MKRDAPQERRGTAGFTLVELLVVMGIIGVLVGLLMPAVNHAIVSVHCASTQSIISECSAGLEAFKNDFGVFPPSAGGGAENLGKYLSGPQGHGWGAGADNDEMPFGGTSKQQYGPYFVSEKAVGQVTTVGDTFRPTKSIFYYRADAAVANPTAALFAVDHNKTDAARAADGFADNTHFLMLVRPSDAADIPRWVRQDYLLISPGPDRLYGYVTLDPHSGVPEPAQPTTADKFCDDITNFAY